MTLAEMVTGANQPAISALITRDSQTSTLLFGFADALNVNPRWLLDGTGESGLEATDDPLTQEEENKLRRELVDYWEHLPASLQRRLLSEARNALAYNLEKTERVNAALRKRLGITGSATDRRVEESIGLPEGHERRNR